MFSPMLDVEGGDAAVTTAVAWCGARRAAIPAGYPPVIYCNRGTLTAALRRLIEAGGEGYGATAQGPVPL